jgi:Tat protein translocase TatB subunit
MEMLVIFVVALLVLGPTKLPEAARQVGRALAEFRKWSTGVQAELRDAMAEDERMHATGAAAHDDTPMLEPAAPADTDAGRSTPRSPSTFPDQQSFT